MNALRVFRQESGHGSHRLPAVAIDLLGVREGNVLVVARSKAAAERSLVAVGITDVPARWIEEAKPLGLQGQALDEAGLLDVEGAVIAYRRHGENTPVLRLLAEEYAAVVVGTLTSRWNAGTSNWRYAVDLIPDGVE